jgi:hypothetical protein
LYVVGNGVSESTTTCHNFHDEFCDVVSTFETCCPVCLWPVKVYYDCVVLQTQKSELDCDLFCNDTISSTTSIGSIPEEEKEQGEVGGNERENSDFTTTINVALSSTGGSAADPQKGVSGAGDEKSDSSSSAGPDPEYPNYAALAESSSGSGMARYQCISASFAFVLAWTAPRLF